MPTDILPDPTAALRRLNVSADYLLGRHVGVVSSKSMDRLLIFEPTIFENQHRLKPHRYRNNIVNTAKKPYIIIAGASFHLVRDPAAAAKVGSPRPFVGYVKGMELRSPLFPFDHEALVEVNRIIPAAKEAAPYFASGGELVNYAQLVLIHKKMDKEGKPMDWKEGCVCKAVL